MGVAILGWAVLLFFAVLFLAYLVQYARISMAPQSAFGVVQEKTAEEDRGEGLVDRASTTASNWEIGWRSNTRRTTLATIACAVSWTPTSS